MKKKLSLNKSTIANLNSEELNEVKGGRLWPTESDTPICKIISIVTGTTNGTCNWYCPN